MADYGKMSDEELLALVQPKAVAAQDYSKMSDADLLKAVTPPSVAEDVAKSAGVGVAKGSIAIAGGAGDLRGLLSKGVDYVGEKVGASPEAVAGFKGGADKLARLTTTGRILSDAPTSRDIQSKTEEYTGEFYKPKTTAGKFAQTAGEFLPAAAAGPGRLAPRIASALASGLGRPSPTRGFLGRWPAACRQTP